MAADPKTEHFTMRAAPSVDSQANPRRADRVPLTPAGRVSLYVGLVMSVGVHATEWRMPMITIRDVSLYVRVMGDGYPLVVLHGGPGLDHTTLESLAPLAKHFTLILYDHRANGRSTGATESMTFENLVADADALRETLGYERWAVAGHSFGGHVALEYALRHPNRVSHLLLLDTAADAYWYQQSAPSILEKRGWNAKAVASAKQFFNGELRLGQIRSAVMRFFFAYFYTIRLRDVTSMISSAVRLKMRPEAMVQGFRVLLKHWSAMNRLGEIRMPTLVVGGREDFLFPPEHQAIIADRIPGARLEVIEHAGHNAHAEQARRVVAIVENFLMASLERSGGRHENDLSAGAVLLAVGKRELVAGA